MAYQPYGGAAGFPGMEPPEAQSIKSLLHVVRILAIIIGVLLLIGGLAYVAFVVWAYTTCATFVGGVCASSFGYVLFFPVLFVVWGVVDFVVYLQMGEIESLVNQRKYEAAKSKTLIWMILGFILGGIILGVILLVAYIKFDPLITWQRSASGGGQWPTPGPSATPIPPAGAAGVPPPPPPTPMGQTPFCSTCGKPTTFVPQYGRYYCSNCQRYA